MSKKMLRYRVRYFDRHGKLVYLSYFNNSDHLKRRLVKLFENIDKSGSADIDIIIDKYTMYFYCSYIYDNSKLVSLF